jgi:hypothetical protein
MESTNKKRWTFGVHLFIFHIISSSFLSCV